MYDSELVKEILTQILGATKTIIKRFEVIEAAEDFTKSESGSEKLDAIAIQLMAIGESLKKIDKITNKKLLINCPEIDWTGAKGLRDIISHHYFDIDAEQIFMSVKTM